jgi:DNA replication ATP-dependent helicase Dna2
MSHRQKSFFDQKHPAKVSQLSKIKTNSADMFKSKSWKHHYRQDSNSHREVSPPKAAIAAPLIISSKSKSKLRAFEFASSNKMEVAMEKENARPTNGLEASITCSNSKPVGGRSYNQSRAVLEQLRKSPRTPAGRLALADLLGESIANGTVSMIPTGSPDERVLWEHSRSPYSSGQPSSLLPTTKRGKKRARSSSPISSPHPKTPKAKASKEVFDLQQLNSSLKTPAAKAAESKQAMPSAFAHLFETSSPRPADPSHQTKSAALNRSLSCGTEWPTSIAKRRKTKQSSELLKREAGNSGPEAGRSEAASKLSRVNLLMEKVQDSLKTPIKFNSQPGPSSSSPLPDRSDAATEVNGSPLQDRQRKQEEIGKGLPDLEIQMTSPPESRPLKQMISSSSEYGDIQDDDLLEITADSKITANSTGSIDLAASGGLPIEAEDESSSSNRQANSTNTGLTDHHGPAAAPHQVKKPEKANPARTDIYEDDDELPSDDLEELMAEYDDQASKGEACPKTDAPGLDVPDNRAAQANLRTAKGQFQLSGSSADEYGPFVNESEDDLDFLAAEAQASGETAPGHGDQSNVC